MFMITNEQANRLYRLVQRVKGRIMCLDYSNEWQQQKKDLFAEIAANKPTNGDRWRAMSDEQIAEIIQHDGCCACPLGGLTGDCELACMTFQSEEEFNDACKAAIVRWMKMEVEEND